MNPASVDIKEMLLADPKFNFLFAKDLFIAYRPSEPDNCLTIYDAPGGAPQLTLRKGEDLYFPSVHIEVRNRQYQEGWRIINDVMVSLHARNYEVWNGIMYQLIQCTSEPFLLEWDEKHRAIFAVNFDIQRREL